MIAAAAIAGCYTGVDPTQPNRTTPAVTATTVDGTQPADPSMVSGVPCELAQVLAKDCASCHGTKPSGGAPNSMMSYDDLVAASQNDPSMTIAEMSLQRMQDSTTPMPPDGAKAEDLAALQSWVASGMPRSNETCDATPGASFYDTPRNACTSGTTWKGGKQGSKLMTPGQACNACHDLGRGPNLFAAGTVYKTAHEKDDCNGLSSGFTVEITGADKKKVTAPINAAGNFYFTTSVKLPYTARVISADGTKSRVMTGPQTNGDCNLCHTEAGTRLAGDKQAAAPGRVIAP